MKPLSIDTHPEVERIHVQLLFQAGPARRMALTRSLSQSTIEISRTGLQNRHPHSSPQELALRLVALCYGEDLARRVGVYLESRRTP